MNIRHDWTCAQAEQIFALPFHELISKAHEIHKKVFNPNWIQLCSIMSIKTGACPEDCAYCPQSARYKTAIQIERLVNVEKVKAHAKAAKKVGATRLCLGAAWRQPRDKDLLKVIQMVQAIKAEGLEACITLGMLTQSQVQLLEQAGLDYYNHNLDTSESHYPKIITTRTYQERLDTIAHIQNSKIKTCCGGILGMNESHQDRLDLLCTLANLKNHPESVPINLLCAFEGTPLAQSKGIDSLEFIRYIALTRIMLPKSFVRLSAGRAQMSKEMQALCFYVGANSFFCTDKIFISDQPGTHKDLTLLKRLQLTPMTSQQLATYHNEESAAQ